MCDDSRDVPIVVVSLVAIQLASSFHIPKIRGAKTKRHDLYTTRESYPPAVSPRVCHVVVIKPVFELLGDTNSWER
jgi:hypothetical protein